MSQSSLTSERITAVLSTLVAVAILAAGVTAQHSRAPLDELEQLESDLQFQLDWAFRHDSKERLKRIARLEETMEAWQSSPRSEEDKKLLASWLLESTIRSIPGTTKPLTEVPEFNKPAIVVVIKPLVTEPVKMESAGIEPTKTEPVGTKPPVSRTVQSLPPKMKANQHAEPANVSKLRIPKATLATNPLVSIVPIANSRPVANSTEDLFRDPSEDFPQVDATQVDATQVDAPQVDAPQIEPPKIAKPAEPTEKPIQINLTELAARIAGYHEELDLIETSLLLANSPDLDFLEKQVKELDELTRDFRFVELYYKALSEEEQKHITTPRWMHATLAEIERLLQRHESQQDGDFLGSFDPTQNRRIKELRQQLATIEEHQTN